MVQQERHAINIQWKYEHTFWKSEKFENQKRRKNENSTMLIVFKPNKLSVVFLLIWDYWSFTKVIFPFLKFSEEFLS